MKKILLMLSIFCMGGMSNFSVFAESNSPTSVNEKAVQSNAPSPISSDSKEDQLSTIINEMKNKNISDEDMVNYSKSIKSKLNESMVAYFNEIKGSTDLIINDKTGVSDDDMKKRAESLNSQIDETVSQFNDGAKDQLVQQSFQNISQQYIQLIKDYKEKIDNMKQKISK